MYEPHRLDIFSDLETAKQVFELVWRKIPGQFDKKVMNIFNNDLMFAILCSPYAIQILQTQHFLFDTESDKFV